RAERDEQDHDGGEDPDQFGARHATLTEPAAGELDLDAFALQRLSQLLDAVGHLTAFVVGTVGHDEWRPRDGPAGRDFERLRRRYAGHRGELGEIVVDGGAVLGDVGEHSSGVVAAAGGEFLGEERVAAFRPGGVVAGNGRATDDGDDKGDDPRKEHSSP